MLDGENFLKSGWVHGLRLTRFEIAGKVRYIIMGKVNTKILKFDVLLMLTEGEAFPAIVSHSSHTLDCC